MKKGKHTEEQIIGVLKQVEAGRTVKEVARELGVSEATIYTWKSKYGGMEVNEARRLKELEDENRRLKHMVAEPSVMRNQHHPAASARGRRCLSPFATHCLTRQTHETRVRLLTLRTFRFLRRSGRFPRSA
jgi:putative transposase